MKILLVTLHSQNNNFGSVLQAYSLTKFLEESGFDVETLDYRPFYSNGGLTKLKRLKKIIVNTIFLFAFIKRKKRFDSIINKQVLTRRYNTISELLKDKPIADIYMIGSDQVWNTNYLCGNDPVYYLDFVQSSHKMSYAASVGRLINDDSQLLELKNKLKDFKFISFRENKTAQQMQQVGLSSAKYVLDPVFLHDADYYRKLQTDIKRQNYILAYIINKDPFISEVLDYVRKKTGKRIIEIGGFQSKCNSNEFLRSAGPREFLALIDNADMVVTSSFHGLAFSHIYNKQFIVVMPQGNTLRLENILETAGTTSRVVNHISQVDDLLKHKINYSEVNAIILEKRKESINYLISSIKCFENDGNL